MRGSCLWLVTWAFLASVLNAADPFQEIYDRYRAAAASARPDSPAGLKTLMEELVQAVQQPDTAAAAALARQLILPDAVAWFTRVFGEEQARRLADGYARGTAQFDTQFVDLVKKAAADGRKNVVVLRIESADDKNATGLQATAIRAMRNPVALHTVKLAGESGSMSIWSFVHDGTTFRVIGKLPELAEASAPRHDATIPQPAPVAPIRPSPAQAGGIRKDLTPTANVALFRPEGWAVKESAAGSYRIVDVTDPTGELLVSFLHGLNPQGDSADAVIAEYVRRLANRRGDMAVVKAWRREARVALALNYTGDRGRRECHLWASTNSGNFILIACDTPLGQYEPNRAMLLSIASNMRVTAGSTPMRAALTTHRLGDGSAEFKIPAGWQVKDLGKGQFIAVSAADQGLFMSANVGFMTPQWAPRGVQGIKIANFCAPSDALRMVILKDGIADSMQVFDIKTLHQGPRLIVQTFLFNSAKAGKPSKGFSFALSQATPAGTTWGVWHLTVASAAEQFNAMVPTFRTMMESFNINEQFAKQYVAQGMARVREMERETAAIIRRNADDIRRMNTEIYENKCRSRDWQSYGWSQYIRGESDWVSSVEGGKVYRSDSWGLTDRETGDFWKGKHWDYTHFEGQNPRYAETMQEVNSREAYERYVKGR